MWRTKYLFARPSRQMVSSGFFHQNWSIQSANTVSFLCIFFLLPSQLNTWQKQISCQGEAWKFIKGVLQIVQNSSIYSMPKVSFTCWETINFLTKELSNQWRPKFTSKARTLRHTFLKDGRDRTERLATGILWVVVEPAWVPSAYPAVRKWH